MSEEGRIYIFKSTIILTKEVLQERERERERERENIERRKINCSHMKGFQFNCVNRGHNKDHFKNWDLHSREETYLCLYIHPFHKLLKVLDTLYPFIHLNSINCTSQFSRLNSNNVIFYWVKVYACVVLCLFIFSLSDFWKKFFRIFYAFSQQLYAAHTVFGILKK